MGLFLHIVEYVRQVLFAKFSSFLCRTSRNDVARSSSRSNRQKANRFDEGLSLHLVYRPLPSLPILWCQWEIVTEPRLRSCILAMCPLCLMQTLLVEVWRNVLFSFLHFPEEYNVIRHGWGRIVSLLCNWAVLCLNAIKSLPWKQ